MAAVGALFVGVQVLAHDGVIDVRWSELESRITRLLDANGDGRVSTDDCRIWFDRAQTYLQVSQTCNSPCASASVLSLTTLQFGLPGGAGFSAGFSAAALPSIKKPLFALAGLCALPLSCAHLYQCAPPLLSTLSAHRVMDEVLGNRLRAPAPIEGHNPGFRRSWPDHFQKCTPTSRGG